MPLIFRQEYNYKEINFVFDILLVGQMIPGMSQGVVLTRLASKVEEYQSKIKLEEETTLSYI